MLDGHVLIFGFIIITVGINFIILEELVGFLFATLFEEGFFTFAIVAFGVGF